ncbi:discoidin domain-containing protein [Kibdelosporangium aridum]|uniref:F5/8 type C domain-containing protein n=1 Tax=Kibdelosporangium aridum TaxID=2030 RepID=A0A1W2EH96_KIBAR|nr:discoidin domain-containing protein [Kibdelosporangium aridum]SMD09090.1 F5/8 type C domain-containing protein [Kibdelosporangium aridum]
MRTLRSIVGLLVFLLTLGMVTAPPASASLAVQAVAADVHLFYYPWYGNPSLNGNYRHWQQGGHTPPDDIGADFYPALGAYDSGDTAVIDQHMRWIQQSGAGTIISSWWGQGSYEDRMAPAILASAARHGIKVAWHLEPYGTRTAESTVSDINYINAKYGSSPAFYRYGNRGAFYVFESLRITDWSALEQVKSTSIVLAQTTDPARVAHFGGMYTYDGIAGATAPGWKTASDFCKANGLVWAPSVAPGYIDDRGVPGNTTPTVHRDNGAMYDRQWSNALNPATGGAPTWVSVTSFNEWHEGSTIEPARSNPPAGHGYLTYQGAYGKTGSAAETSYLDRTKYWVGQFTGGSIPPTNPNLAQGKPISASSTQNGYPAVNANDGNTNSYWESANHAFPQSLTLDLGTATEVSKLVLSLPPSWGPRTQTLTVYGDGSAIVPAKGYTFDPASRNTVTITFPATAQRTFRLHFTGNTGWPAGQIAELQAYRIP